MRWLLILCLAMLVVACGGAAAEPTATPEFTATVGPSPTPVPTATQTVTPSPTPEPPCSTDDGQLAFDLLEEFAQEWEDVLAVASSTGRIALSGPVQDLQRIRRDVQRQEWPECAEDAHTNLIAMMDATIDGFLAFMQQKSDLEVNRHIEEATDHQDQFIDEMVKLRPDESQ